MLSGKRAPNIAVGRAMRMMSGSRKLSILRRQHQIDDDEREHEHIDERVALLLVLAGIALEVIGVAFREDLLRFLR